MIAKSEHIMPLHAHSQLLPCSAKITEWNFFKSLKYIEIGCVCYCLAVFASKRLLQTHFYTLRCESKSLKYKEKRRVCYCLAVFASKKATTNTFPDGY